MPAAVQHFKKKDAAPQKKLFPLNYQAFVWAKT